MRCVYEDSDLIGCPYSTKVVSERRDQMDGRIYKTWDIWPSLSHNEARPRGIVFGLQLLGNWNEH